MKKYPTIGACGLDCGLCPRYYTAGLSRCPGCAGPGFFDKHPSCSFITCCVKARGLEVCGQCPDSPCSKFKSEERYRELDVSSSYPPCRRMLSNLAFVKEHGLARFIAQQRKRMALLDTMLADFDEGRSKSVYCRSAALLDPAALKRAVARAAQRVRTDGVPENDRKTKARVLRAMLG